jgi:predicted DNA-binding protein (UPF0251 family)
MSNIKNNILSSEIIDNIITTPDEFTFILDLKTFNIIAGSKNILGLCNCSFSFFYNNIHKTDHYKLPEVYENLLKENQKQPYTFNILKTNFRYYFEKEEKLKNLFLRVGFYSTKNEDVLIWNNCIVLDEVKVNKDESVEFIEDHHKMVEEIKFLVKSLSKRELEILRLVLKNVPSKDISNSLGISQLTIDTHRKNIKKKVGKFYKNVWLKIIVIYLEDSYEN